MVDGVVVTLDGERQQRIFELRGALHAHRLDDGAEPRAVTRGQAAHHAKVDVDDLPVAHQHVARMRIGMEKAEIQHLCGIVIQDLLADLLQVVSCSAQLLEIVDGDAVDVLHDQDVLAAQLRIHLRTRDEGHILVQQRELLQVGRFALEIRFLEKRCPQFLDHIAQVEHLPVFDEPRRLPSHDTHDVDILRHGGAHAWPLDLHRHHAAVGKTRLVHLRQGSASERLGVDLGEDLFAFVTVDRVHGRKHLIERKRLRPCLQLLQLIAISLGQDLRAGGKRLPDLHEAGAQTLQHAAEGFGREPLREVMLLHDGVYLAQPLRARFARKVELPLGVNLGTRREEVLQQRVVGHGSTRPLLLGGRFGLLGRLLGVLGLLLLLHRLRRQAHRDLGRLRGEGLALLGGHDRHARLKRIEARGLRGVGRLVRKLGVDLLALLDGKLALRDKRAHQICGLLARDGHSPHASQEDVLETIADRCHVSLPFFTCSHIRQAPTYL